MVNLLFSLSCLGSRLSSSLVGRAGCSPSFLLQLLAPAIICRIESRATQKTEKKKKKKSTLLCLSKVHTNSPVVDNSTVHCHS